MENKFGLKRGGAVDPFVMQNYYDRLNLDNELLRLRLERERAEIEQLKNM